MGDNEHPHRAHLLDLENEDIRQMNKPARSPKQNPTQHAWDSLAISNASRKSHPRISQANDDAEGVNQLPQELTIYLSFN